MENLYGLKDTLMDSLDNTETVRTGKLKIAELEALNYITDTIKNIDKICMLEEECGYSEAGGWDAHINGTYGNSRRSGRGYSGNNESYNDGSSYANRGKHLVRSHYSRADGKGEVMKHLEKAMDNAESSKERDAIERAMKIVENE
ncbi:MAG: hypothetical protein NC253_05415 [Ruminococcus sp.]|nr:hypothetical protein [Ruminococcus sp.]MCM1381810.1 hypothetical protein [Muribaculaceae bacterium]MCM1478268.1 hypothetical protein [Muribaculaceae bacterium]